MSNQTNKTIVDQLYIEFKEISTYLEKNSEVSFLNIVDTNFRKAILLAAASYFERRVIENIVNFVNISSTNNYLLVELVKNKAIKRQYHTFFDWERSNANKFFGLFGDIFMSFMKVEINNDENFDKSIKAFLEIGRERNRLVHQDFGSFTLEKTADEIYLLYQNALIFVDSIAEKLHQCMVKNTNNDD